MHIQDFAETAMNELLGWYGYSNVDRNDLTKSSRITSSMDTSGTYLVDHTINLKSMNTIKTTAKIPPPATSSRTTNSTPEHYKNSSSPDSSGRHSKSPIALRKLIDKQGLYVSHFI